MLKFIGGLLLLYCTPLMAQTWQLQTGEQLQKALVEADAGDILRLAEGTYQGNFIIDKSLLLIGESGTVIDAGGQGDAIRIKAAGVMISGLTVLNWGDDLTEQNAAIYVEKQATHIEIVDNRLSGDGFGIYLDKTRDVKVLNNDITGNEQMRSADRGNGIQLALVKNVEVRGNTVTKTRDGLYIISSQNNILSHNTMHKLRYGIHYMYSHSNQVSDNLAYDTRAGYALMSSKHLIVTNNTSRNSEDYGFLMNFITYSTISGNHIDGVWTKAENKVDGRDGKALFVYNSLFNKISYNHFANAEIGIHLTAGSEDNKIFANNFINNPTQVKYVATREQQWSQNKQGNYWSNYVGWDLDNDGKGDVAFEPNDGIDKLLWQYPEAKVLMDSPAILVLRWVQRQFPVLKPAGVKDSYPLMKPVNARQVKGE